jgi:glycosyltransferase involved in cell wall biosynthesis
MQSHTSVTSPLDDKFRSRKMLPEPPPIKADMAACTIIAKNYLAMARVLAESFQRHNPDCPFFVLLMDPVEGYFNPELEPFHLLEARHLPIPHLEGLLFKYDVMEASTAVKPYLLEYLLKRHELGKLVYFDPDILILNPLHELSKVLDDSSIVLTPHITRPYPDKARPNEYHLLVAGSFNLGFIGLHKDHQTQEFLGWWQRMVYQNCVSLPERGLFVDQKWIDLVPGLYDDVAILREPGYNVAYWNLHERRVTIKNDDVFINDEPCYFFHFSGFNLGKPSEISKHQTRHKMSGLGDGKELFLRYRDLVAASGWKQSSKWPYTYEYFDNGVRIPKIARRYYWGLGEQVVRYGNPFNWLGNMETSEAPAADANGLQKHADEQQQQAGEKLPFGVNVVGYVTSEKGVGEVARSNVRILQSVGVPCIANSFVDTGSKNLESPPKNLHSTNPYSINLICVNADQTPYFAQKNKDYLRGRYNIGYWLWELSEFPEEWYGSFDYIDELWVPTKFMYDCLSAISPVPVNRVPCSIDPETKPSSSWGRAEFGLKSDEFVFLFLFDFHSYMERKNPVGLIRAFKQAFGNRKDVVLLIKTARADFDPTGRKLLQAEARGANVRFLDEVLPREAINSLISAANCYVSLHRSEGFGLTLSESMMLGKPVIATAYSGNMDFTTEQNSFLVRYKLREIEQSYGPYKAGWVWADPDLDHAAEQMRYVFENPEAAARIAARGRADVMANLHPRILGEEVKARLEVLQREKEGNLVTTR